ncbi:MAG: HAD-IA family hydrolase [Planctomycetes bacterium]|nr:HAD-IA family hydrolase [Planctomycetota bacterium]
MSRPLDAIFFDIDDTLFSTSVFADKARRAAVDAMVTIGLRATRDECVKELTEVVQEFSSNYGMHFDKLIERLPPESSAGLNREILVAAGIVAYHETKWRELKVYDDCYEVLRWLGSRVPIRGIISAGIGIKQAEKVVRLRVHEFLSPQAIFFTEQIGINKPNPKLYRRVLRDLGLSAERTMYVGDNPINDIDPANEIGMITVHNRRSGRHAHGVGATEPDYSIGDFYDLRDLLQREFGL